MARDLGYEFQLVAGTDSSAAKGVASRRGVGKIRHLHTPLLWLQMKTRDGEIKVFKVPKEVNWADLATKVHDQRWTNQRMMECDFEMRPGRSKLALAAAV